MNPKEVIELTVSGFVIATLSFIALFLKGKWRKIVWSLAVVVLTTFFIYLVGRPLWIDKQIGKKVELLRPYLEQRYPGEKWVIQTIPFREKGFKNLNPYYIGVVFDSEPDVTYNYWVEDKNTIYTVAYSTKPGYSYELKHFEKEK